MSFLKDFKQFAVKGNVVDMAVGVIIGTAFGKIVSSLVADVIMPLVGVVLGKIDFSSLAVTIGNSTIAYGKFLQSISDFLIVALCIFVAVKQISRFRRHTENETSPPTPPEEVKLLTEIRDLLKK